MKQALAGLLLVIWLGAALPGLVEAAPKKSHGGATSAPASQAATPKKVHISEINRDMLNQLVSVRGSVARMIERPSKTREQITIITLHEGESTIEVVYWADIAKKIPADQKPAATDNVRVVGKVNEYRGRLQITLESADGIRKLKPKKAKPDEKAAGEKDSGRD